MKRNSIPFLIGLLIAYLFWTFFVQTEVDTSKYDKTIDSLSASNEKLRWGIFERDYDIMKLRDKADTLENEIKNNHKTIYYLTKKVANEVNSLDTASNSDLAEFFSKRF